ncbi:hypothetical protein [Salinactinospora qingdaonensis]|uniref:Ig-like domain-containing protein n=1 Tax=Salinactinospora qingdaonensis TaxID=702744 RepID=A0ABP7EU21_9ACTN
MVRSHFTAGRAALVSVLGLLLSLTVATGSAQALSQPQPGDNPFPSLSNPSLKNPTPGWACDVPAGYTYDHVNRVLYDCNPNGWGYEYHVVKPTDGLWACDVPYGSDFTYDHVNDSSACSPTGSASLYRLQVPEDGLWACEIPSGFTYDHVNDSSACSPNGSDHVYRLREPADGLWACEIPSGYTYDHVNSSYSCSPNGSDYIYRLVSQ